MHPTPRQFDLVPTPNLLEVLGDIPLEPWACLAELIDNSLDSFLADESQPVESEPTVLISLPTDEEPRLTVVDNGSGMSDEQFEASLRAGYSDRPKHGSFGLFGMGFNIATARLGSVTTVKTATRESDSWTAVTIDFQALQAQQSFKVDVTQEPKAAPDEHGTVIQVHLKKEIHDKLKRKQGAKQLSAQLGDVYSYLLRDEIPGVEDASLSGPLGIRIKVNDEVVLPRLPCIWSETRSVPYKGDSVPAFIKIDKDLSPAWICLECGYWERLPDPVTCRNCGKSSFEQVERRVWGWLGVQRYIDTQDYGIDFLRNGRKILIRDKSLFTYQDPDTGQTEIEYPIEMPANRGRLVGEIHLDHAKVTYQKNNFDRERRDFDVAQQIIRGQEPMKGRRSASNSAPLARLYSAFRRNDPGTRYLTPGDGKKALNDAARQWGQQFHAGVSSFRTDEHWYEAVLQHQRVKDGVADTGSEDSGDNDGAAGVPGAGSTVSDVFGPAGEGSKTKDSLVPETTETDEQRFARYQANGIQRWDLTAGVTLKNFGSWDLSVWVTEEPIVDGDEKAISESRLPSGNKLEVYVSAVHPLFTDFARDPADYALLEAASRIIAIEGGNEDQALQAVAAELFANLPDQKVNEANVAEQAENVLRRLRETLAPVISTDPERYWLELNQSERIITQNTAAAQNAEIDWSETVQTGDFSQFLSFNAVACLVGEFPGAFLDGHVFKPGWRNWESEEARHNVVQRITACLTQIGGLLSKQVPMTAEELQIVRLLIQTIDETIVLDEDAPL